MLVDYFEGLKEKRSHTFLTKDDFTDWKMNPLTVQFLEDMEKHVITAALEGMESNKFSGMREAMGYACDWKPDYIDEEEE